MQIKDLDFSLEIFWILLFSSNSGISGGYQKIKILDKRPRESTDLEEYVFLVPKNII